MPLPWRRKESEREPVKGLKAGWRALCEKHCVAFREADFISLYRLVKKRLQREEDVCDVFQNAYAKLLLADIDKEQELVKYASVTLRNCVNDHLSRVIRKESLTTSFDEPESNEASEYLIKSFHTGADAQIQSVLAKEILGELSDNERDLFINWTRCEYSYKNLSKHTGIAEATLRQQILRLRGKIESYYNDPIKHVLAPKRVIENKPENIAINIFALGGHNEPIE